MSRVVNFKPAEDGQNLPGSTGQNKSGVVIIALAITLIYLSIKKMCRRLFTNTLNQ